MRILVIGKGGREHAICWKLSLSRNVSKIFVAPGNAGMAGIAETVPIPSDDLRGLADFAKSNSIDLTVVGPEAPLTMGIVDEFESRGLKIFGPSKKASVIEGSKAFAKDFMQRYHIPTASFRIFDGHFEALDFVKSAGYPLVVKADGLAAGKGAIICQNPDEACGAVEKLMVQKMFGSAGMKLVIEECLEGEEVTLMAFTDGKNIVPMVPSQDHKRIFDGDRGPNTGGMGAYAPATFIDQRLTQTLQEQILEPTIRGLAKEGRIYRGVLYMGLMITNRGPKVLEYNCRFGDPETQAVLPLLESDLAEIFADIAEGFIHTDDVRWSDKSAACVVLASGGYPDNYRTGFPINGIENIAPDEGLVFHAGTAIADGKLVTAGGRVLGVTGIGVNLKEALRNAYHCVDKINFEQMHYRKDIGWRANNPPRGIM